MGIFQMQTMNTTSFHNDFLLDSNAAQELYHKHAAGLPIIDYHCHLSPREIAEDRRFNTITELWLGGDHYKWRAMRANGIDEHFITGDAGDWEKFEKWASTVPYTLRNPLYHWTHLELLTAFGISTPLNPKTARAIYERCNEILAQPNMSARGLMSHYKVEAVCTTDDPVDTLHYHSKIRESNFEIKVLPAWRPDKAMNIGGGKDFSDYLLKLGKTTDIEVDSYSNLLAALLSRHDYFAQNGCSIADHGVCGFPTGNYSPTKAGAALDHALCGKELGTEEIENFKTTLLIDLCRMNAKKGWVQQFHFGPMRNVNSRRFQTLGPDSGFDTIGAYDNCLAVSRVLDHLDNEGLLAKTILYNLNPADNAWVAAMTAITKTGKRPEKYKWERPGGSTTTSRASKHKSTPSPHRGC